MQNFIISKKDVISKMFIIGLAFVLAILGGLLAGKRNAEYLETRPYYGDTASYTLFNIRAYVLSQHEGRWASIKQQLTENPRHPFRIVPLLLIHPKWLASINAHLITGAVMLFCFLLLLGLTVEWRTNNLAYATTSMFATFTAQSFYHPTNGFGANYPDFGAGLFVGCAVLALLRSEEGRENRWLVWFGIFAALATLSKWTASGFTFFICAPILAYYLMLRWRTGEKLWPLLTRKLACIALPILILAGYFLIRFSKDNLVYYSVVGYAFDQGFKPSLMSLKRIIELYYGAQGFAILLLLFVIYWARWWRDRVKASELIITVWVPVSFFILLVFILKVAGDPSTPFYMVPLLQIFCVTPFALRREVLHRTRFSRNLNLFLLVIIGTVAAVTYLKSGVIPPNEGGADQQELLFQRKLTKTLIDMSGNSHYPTFDTFFSPYGRSVVVDSVAQYNKPLKWHQIYNKHNIYWENDYPGLTPSEIGPKAYDVVVEKLQLIAIIDDPRAKEAESLFWNDFKVPQETAVEVIEYMNRRLRQEQGVWEELTTKLESPWGQISVFRKRIAGG